MKPITNRKLLKLPIVIVNKKVKDDGKKKRASFDNFLEGNKSM